MSTLISTFNQQLDISPVQLEDVWKVMISVSNII
jgi:hypothetical protein